MEPYRSPGLTCPHCPGVSLREYQKRYVCDECEGILIGVADFSSAVSELRDEEVKLVYRDECPVDSACPLCERRLTSCKITLEFTTKTKKLGSEFLRCERDGLWCGHGVLAASFSGVAFRWGGGPRPADPAQTGLDGLSSARHGVATDGLRISNWRDRPRRRAKTLCPINAYADRTLPCPACATPLAFQGDQYTCATCRGTFVQNAALVDMVATMANAPWELPAVSGVPGKRACPVCREPMTEEGVGVTLDRCAADGVWFDAGELASTLEHAGLDRGGVGAWLKRLLFQ